MENNTPLDQLSVRPPVTKKRDMPGAGDMLTLGILSIVLFMGLIGVILAIITLVKTNRALTDYRSFPDMWTAASISKVKASQVCGIVSLSLFGGLLLLLVMAAGM